MLIATILAAALVGGDTASAPVAAAESAPGPALAVHRQPSVPLVTLRLSILAVDPPGFEGIGHLAQHLVAPTLEARVDRVGGRVQIERSDDAVVYAVTGPAAELEFLASALKAVIAPPSASGAQSMRARQQLAEERLAEWETAPAHVRAALRAELFPHARSAAGTPEGTARLATDAAVAEAWAMLYRPERVILIAVGDVAYRAVETAFADLPDVPVRADAEGTPTSVPPLAEPQATRAWIGFGYPADGLAPAAVSVAARLIGEAARARVPAEAVVAEHWWSHHGQAVAVIGAVQPSSQAAARPAFGRLLRETEADLTAERVRAAAAAIGRQLLIESRTSEGMATLIGRFADRSGDPDAAQTFYAALATVSVDDVRDVLLTLTAREASTVVLPPQRVPNR